MRIIKDSVVLSVWGSFHLTLILGGVMRLCLNVKKGSNVNWVEYKILTEPLFL